MWPFGLSEDVQRRVRELKAAWQDVAAFGLPASPEISKLYREDIAKVGEVLDAAAKGDVDVGDLTGAEISARRVMWALHEKNSDARFAPEKRPQGGDIDAALPIASAIDREVKAASKEASAAVTAVPVEYKIGGAALLLVLLALLLKR